VPKTGQGFSGFAVMERQRNFANAVTQAGRINRQTDLDAEPFGQPADLTEKLASNRTLPRQRGFESETRQLEYTAAGEPFYDTEASARSRSGKSRYRHIRVSVQNWLQQSGQMYGGMLQIGIHEQDHIPARPRPAGTQRSAFAQPAGMLDDDSRPAGGFVGGLVRAPVIDDDQLRP
jgi:hypothetical protein